MAQKVLFETALTDLRTTDVEGLGNLRFDEKGNVDKWVKNSGTTALSAGGSCLERLTSVSAAVGQRIIAPDGVGAATGLVTLPAGVPHTAIAASGASTGDHGWVRVKGIMTTPVYQATTALVQGQVSLATNVGGWDKPITFTAGYPSPIRHVRLCSALATTGAATANSCVVYVNCLG